MANYIFKENPTYQTQIRALDNNDPANAETILNPVVETLINNTHAAKLSVDQHKEDSSRHITAVERQKLNGIDEGANKYTHPNSGVSAGTYRSVTVNTGGHITSGNNPTTISGYGLTDAYTKNEVDTKITTHTSNTSSHVSTTDRTNWNDASSKKHEHSNKTVLDGITSTKISNWDSASTNNHTHSNKSVLEGISSAKITSWDNASTNNHTHINKAVLDSISQSKLNTWDGYNQNITDLKTRSNVQTITITGQNLNNYRTTGMYYFGVAYTPTNIPTGNNGWLHVLNDGDVNVKQIWYRNGTLNTNDFMSYVRTYQAGSWSTWRKLFTSADQQCGSVLLTPPSANSTISKKIIFAVPFSTAPVIQVSAYTAYPHVTLVSFNNVNATDFTVYLRRTDGSNETSILWTATARN